MADNVAITAGAGTVIATDDISSVHYQKIKIALGAENAVDMMLDSGQQTAANSVPVTMASDQGDIKITLDSEAVTLASNSGVDVGDVTINNAAAAAAVNIQDGGNSITVDNGGTFATQESQILVDDAGFTPATSKVFPVGFTLDDTTTDVVDEGDIGAARITGDRKLVVALGEAGPNFVRGGGSKTDTTDQSVMAASGAAAIFNYLCWVTGYNSSATNTYVLVKDGATTVAVIPLPAYGGFAVSFPTPIRSTGNTAFFLAAGGSVTTAYLYGGGYKGV
jgi:hypothetical protein